MGILCSKGCNAKSYGSIKDRAEKMMREEIGRNIEDLHNEDREGKVAMIERGFNVVRRAIIFHHSQ